MIKLVLSIGFEPTTSAQLADVYQQKELIPAKLVGGKKVAGLRSLKPALCEFNALKEFFGNRLLRDIKPSHVEDFKKIRFDTDTIHGTQRAVASVNHELKRLRAIFNFARREGWIVRSPFDSNSSLIDKTAENKRDKILEFDEELRLLEALRKPRRKHLLPIFITALETSARKGELLKLIWQNVDFDNGIITFVSGTTKNETQRLVGMTENVKSELSRLWDSSPKTPDALVFGVKHIAHKTLKKLFIECEFKNFHFHDTRHTATTRMVNEGLPSAEIMKITGHTQHSTFARYVNPSVETLRQNAVRLGEYNARGKNEVENKKAFVAASDEKES